MQNITNSSKARSEIFEKCKSLTGYARRRYEYIRDYQPKLLEELLSEEYLYEHCLDAQEEADELYERLLPQYLESYGVTEELKRTDQMKWVGLYNNARACISEIIAQDILYPEEYYDEDENYDAEEEYEFY